jgi:hypothetical protein
VHRGQDTEIRCRPANEVQGRHRNRHGHHR